MDVSSFLTDFFKDRSDTRSDTRSDADGGDGTAPLMVAIEKQVDISKARAR